LIGKIFGVDLRGFGNGFVFYFYGEEGCAGDGGGAALAEEAGLGDAVGFWFHARGKREDVAADGIGDIDGRGGVGEFACVARGLEMVENRIAEHCLSIPRVRGSGNALEFESRESLKTS
jgi:hypothetical protein